MKKHVKKTKAHFLDLKIVVINIIATFNNIIVTIASIDGKVLSFASGGSIGFSGSKKSTPYAGSLAVDRAIDHLFTIAPNVNSCRIVIKGPGSSRESAIRTVGKRIVKVISIQDVTAIPHNGCTPTRPRSI